MMTLGDGVKVSFFSVTLGDGVRVSFFSMTRNYITSGLLFSAKI